jgi:hypothetical protein
MEERKFLKGECVVAKRVRLRARVGHQTEAAKLGVPEAGLEYTEKVAVFTLRELDEMTAEEGMTRVAEAGGYEGQPLGQGSRWILVFRKSAKDETK